MVKRIISSFQGCSTKWVCLRTVQFYGSEVFRPEAMVGGEGRESQRKLVPDNDY